ncbi:MAG: prepilin-type N-terminal cleavage/methylation domain-containing protein [Gemmatimonadota bacterium]|nr:prepilin-type N-terminal cleavage/methylation domain-containing protein [Gemmatimonadota bacterium]
MSKRGGPTLIELMIVVVIIGILAAVAIPKHNVMKHKAHLSTVIHDLKNLETSHEAFASSSSGVYFSHTYILPSDTANTFGASQRVSVVVAANGQSGCSATATHTGAPGHACAVFVGVAPVAPATFDGAPACD